MSAPLTGDMWLVLDLLVRAKRRGVQRLNRAELLTFNELPPAARMRLTFAALAVPAEFVRWVDHHHFEITPAGEAAFAARFGPPTAAADVVLCLEPASPPEVVICLPGPEHPMNRREVDR